MKVVIIGGAGLLGRALICALVKRHTVIILDKHIPPCVNEMLGVTCLQADILDLAELQECIPMDVDLIIHAAAIIQRGLSGSRMETKKLLDVNILGLNNVLSLLKEFNIAKFLFCSSMTVYSEFVKIPANESGQLDPKNFYALSKVWGEQAINIFTRIIPLHAVVIRYPGFFGVQRENGYIHMLFEKMLSNKPIEVDAAGMHIWEAMLVDHAAEITARFIDAYDWDNVFDVYNCGYGENIAFSSVPLRIKKLLGSSSYINTGTSNYVQSFYMDVSKLKKRVHYTYTFDGALQEYGNCVMPSAKNGLYNK